MLEQVLNQELETLEMELLESYELEEVMAGGVGCENASCAGTCGSMGTHN